MKKHFNKNLTFTIYGFYNNKNLVIIDNKQFTNSSLDKMVKNLSDDDFIQLTQEFGPDNLKLLKQKDAYRYEYVDSFERFSENKTFL